MNLKEKETLELVKSLNILNIRSGFKKEDAYNREFERYFHNYLSITYDNICENFKIVDDICDMDMIILEIDQYYDTATEKYILEFIRHKKSESSSVLVFTLKRDELSLSQKFKDCICMDGFLPTPFDEHNLRNFFHPFLRLMFIIKDLYVYIGDLESTKEIREDEFIELDNLERFKDIRFTQEDKVSSSEFLSTLDEGIIDHIESFSQRVETLISYIYDFDDAKTTQDFSSALENIKIIILETSTIVDSLLVFGVITRAFGTLYGFLDKIDINEFEDVEKKSLFFHMMMSITKDLEGWINTVFISQSTDNIHYFDASFSSNVLEIENIFAEDTSNDEDDDLEFF